MPQEKEPSKYKANCITNYQHTHNSYSADYLYIFIWLVSTFLYLFHLPSLHNVFQFINKSYSYWLYGKNLFISSNN